MMAFVCEYHYVCCSEHAGQTTMFRGRISPSTFLVGSWDYTQVARPSCQPKAVLLRISPVHFQFQCFCFSHCAVNSHCLLSQTHSTAAAILLTRMDFNP